MKKDCESILRYVHDNKIGFIRLWFTDVLGFLKGFAITPQELERAFETGMGFDGSSIEGFARIDESDMIAKPDPSTFSVFPWTLKDGTKMARMFCDVLTVDNEPYDADPRYILKRQLAEAAKLGYTFYIGPELEFFYFKLTDGKPQLIDAGGYFDQTPLDLATDLRKETIVSLQAMDIEVEYSHHEVAHSQHEIDLRYKEALQMADNTVTYRALVKEVAYRNGFYASFMPKPLSDQNGSGMHTHQSLFAGDKNLFYDAKDDNHLSPLAKQYISGLLHHCREFTLVTNQWVNSFKRLVPGYEAPVYITWAMRNRSDLIRIPAYVKGKERSVRLEYRGADPACNPYLAFAVLLAAGLEGIKNNYQVPEPVKENVYKMGKAERESRGIQCLPGNLFEAIKAAESSDFLRRTLGNHVFDKLIENKTLEWEEYNAHVSQFEMDKYFPLL